MKNSIALVVTMRTGSSRLPGKMTMPIVDGKCSIDFFKVLFDRLKEQHRDLIKPVIAIPDCEGDSFISQFTKRGMAFFKGSEDNVLHRVMSAAKSMKCKYVLDITGDCPFVSKALIDLMIESSLPAIKNGERFYRSNVFPARNSPDGQDIQLYSTALLEELHASCDYLQQHSGWNVFEHFKLDESVTVVNMLKPMQGKFRNEDEIRMTLDTKEDIQTLQKMHKMFFIFDSLQTPIMYKQFVQYMIDVPDEWWPNRKIKAKAIGE